MQILNNSNVINRALLDYRRNEKKKRKKNVR